MSLALSYWPYHPRIQSILGHSSHQPTHSLALSKFFLPSASLSTLLILPNVKIVCCKTVPLSILASHRMDDSLPCIRKTAKFG